MTFTPNIGDSAQLMDILQLQATLAGYSLVDPSEAEVTPGSADLTVDVAEAPSGVRLGGAAEDFAGETGVDLPLPDAEDPRKALVYLDSNGDIQAIGGDPATPPSGGERTTAKLPTVPIPEEDYLPLAEVWLPADAGDIVEADISSRRLPFLQGEGSGLNAGLFAGNTVSDVEPPIYGDGSDGDRVITDDVSDSGTYYHDRFEIEAGQTLTLDGNNLIIHAREEIVIDGTIDGTGVGGAGGLGSDDGSGEDGEGADLVGPGGEGGAGDFSGGGGGGSGGSQNLSNDERAELERYLLENWNNWYSEDYSGGAGGGGGGLGFEDTRGGDGGDGSGVVVLIAPSVSGDGLIDLRGKDGEDGESSESISGGAGGGGGGCGGYALVAANRSDPPTINVQAGSGGAGGNGADNGSIGSDGRVVIL